ncbi:hypothetical protein QTP70_007285 [Hemibagrus guttatus]|uniref:Reverse transcriptase domain-containing protein n=1 Tax=Hemibagrus guttatus TaxID=175788 RepID=A0AAE0V544_9TELE|nr:hypothetical protein QTP70_007285 [Hemibagrus guttatus]KAK3568461.1 hypothetical protein QTP86_007911 [Hemibagrus guttatus]
MQQQFQTNDSASVWKGLKAITNYKPRAPHSVNDLRLANSLNEYYCRFERQWNSPDPPQSSPHQLSPTQLHTSATPHPPPLTPLTIKEEEVNRLFKRLNIRKATGPDSISPSLLKHCANQLSPVFTDIFNTSLETCHVPACFKTSAIVPVPKKTKITGLNDYRPVALTSVVMKSFERLVLSYLKDITDPLLDPLQFAYRANRSVDDAVNMALHFILQHLDSPGSYARILFVDFSSAFNTIIPALLRDKLFQLNVPDSMCSWITDFLTDRRQFVRLGTHVSDLQHISTGSPQGCVLSPLLFSLYTNGCTSGHQSVKLLKFADDTTLIGLISDGNESAYRGEIDRLVSWCSTNNLELNSLKTVEMTVDFRKDPAPRPPVILCDSPVSSAESFCFLGTIITKELKWAQNISYLTKKAQQRMYFLRQLKKFLLPVKMLVNFYTAIIESVLTSSITVWFAAATARDKAKLQRVIHSAEKVIGCSLPSLQELYFSRSRRRAAKIAADPSHPGKGRELADVMERRKVDILCVQETRWKGSKARSIGAGFKLFYYGVDSKRNGVGVVLKDEFVRNVLEVKRVSDRVMSLRLEIEGVMLNVVSGYAPQVGCELEEKERFWSELDEVMESIPMGERVVIGTDFNGHVGEGNRVDEEVMGKFGVKERNLEGQTVVDFAKRMDMGVVNTYFQKREEHRVTYKSGGRRTQVDYILCRRGNLKEISDCKVVVGESVARQHRMVVCRMTLMVCKKKRSKIEIEKKTKWWTLKKEECCEEFRQKLRQALGGQVVLPGITTAEVIREKGAGCVIWKEERR